MWYEIPGVKGFRINYRGEILDLQGEDPEVREAKPTVRLHERTYRTQELMKLVGLRTPLPALQITHHEAVRDRCDQGHEFTPQNTMRRKGRNGNEIRKCKRCHADTVKRWRHKKAQ